MLFFFTPTLRARYSLSFRVMHSKNFATFRKPLWQDALKWCTSLQLTLIFESSLLDGTRSKLVYSLECNLLRCVSTVHRSKQSNFRDSSPQTCHKSALRIKSTQTKKLISSIFRRQKWVSGMFRSNITRSKFCLRFKLQSVDQIIPFLQFKKVDKCSEVVSGWLFVCIWGCTNTSAPRDLCRLSQQTKRFSILLAT